MYICSIVGVYASHAYVKALAHSNHPGTKLPAEPYTLLVAGFPHREASATSCQGNYYLHAVQQMEMFERSR